MNSSREQISHIGLKKDDVFDINLICQPDKIVVSLPFKTKQSIVPEAGLYLNAMDVAKTNGRITPEEMLMQHLPSYARSITNFDVILLYPHKNINVNKIDLCMSW